MWKWLHPYAKNQAAYGLCGQMMPWFLWIGASLFLTGCVWGLAFAPSDYQQGDAFRIIYVHVPSALLSMGLYSGMAIMAFVGLVWQIKNAYLAMVSIAPVGAMVTVVALATGAIWGKPMWGTWWEWDARLTSELILLFLYLGVLSLYSVFDDRLKAGKVTAILVLVGSVNLPIIHYSVEWWNTLHQGATITKFAKPSMPTEMLIPLLLSLFGYGFLLASLVCYRIQTALLANDALRPWAQKILLQRAQKASVIGEGNK